MSKLDYTRKKTSHLTKEQWKTLRHDSIGGSDASVIMGMNKYRSRYELWGIKSGLYTPDEIINERMWMGNLLESGIFEGAKYWDGNLESSIDNYYTHEKQVNTIEPANYMIYSKKYPFISANLDGIIREDSVVKGKGPGILEIKTMGGWMHDQYEGGLPPYHYIQLQHYLMVTGFKWGRLFVVVDSNKLFVYDFEREEEVIENILEAEIKFWKYVTDARKLVGTDREHEIVEPPVDGSEAEEAFLKKKYPESDEDLIIKGTDKQFQLLVDFEEIKKAEIELADKKRKISNLIKKNMADAVMIDFGDKGKITYRTNKRGVRTFHTNIKY